MAVYNCKQDCIQSLCLSLVLQGLYIFSKKFPGEISEKAIAKLTTAIMRTTKGVIVEEYDIPYSETVNGRGDRGAFLAPDECRICWMEEDKIVRDCRKHK